jgi:hypothetical protein
MTLQLKTYYLPTKGNFVYSYFLIVKNRRHADISHSLNMTHVVGNYYLKAKVKFIL